ncbi:MAG: HAD-IIIC family phosphatase [Rhodospirillaceae bacterium]
MTVQAKQSQTSATENSSPAAASSSTAAATASSAPPATRPARKPVKCLVWDLDDTLWVGILLEGGAKTLRPGAEALVKALDARGILLSIASRNEPEVALARLQDFGLAEYFLAPQIGWGAKSTSVAHVAEALNIGINALAFIDDQPFERDEVAATHPEVLVLDPEDLSALIDHPALVPTFLTEDSRNRRAMYQADQQRKDEEDRFDGPAEEFLAGLNMRLSIHPAREDDLLRAEELTKRTNQLNTTGETFDLDELRAFAKDPEHLLLMAGLEDRYGSYGKIGLSLVHKTPEAWTIRLLLMSCRVMSRGVGAILINDLRDRARAAHVRLLADFVQTDRNRMMYVTFKFNNFRDIGHTEGRIHLENDLSEQRTPPDYVVVDSSWS